MPASVAAKTQLNVRVDPWVSQRLDDQIALARQAGRRVTKETLVEHAIAAAYPEQRVINLPVHHATMLHGAGAMTNAELFDLADALDGDDALLKAA